MFSPVIAERLSHVPRPATLAINARVRALQQSGVDIINLSVGEPDFDTPARIVRAAHEAMAAGQTRYTDVAGVPALREAVCARIRRDYGLAYRPEQVLVSNGGKQCLYNAFLALLNPGDEVIIPTPCWLTYPPQVLLAGGVPVLVPLDESRGFELDVDRLLAALTPRTRVILLNSPSNPTGACYSRETLEAVARVAIQHNLMVITDDLYDRLVYDGFRFTSVAGLPGMQERTLIVNGVSKAYAMTGWRIGYALGPAPLITAMVTLQGQSTSNACSVSQYAALEALSGDPEGGELETMRQAFDARRRRMVALIQEIPDVSCVTPHGAFYTFPNVSRLYGKKTRAGRVLSGSVAFCELLLDFGLAGVPGIEFGSDAHVRFSYACSLEQLVEGMGRFRAAVESLLA